MTALSILIPVYNTPCSALVNTLLSQLNASRLDAFEIVIGNDGSNDAATLDDIELCKKYDHVRVVEHAENQGRSAIRNLLAKESTHDWLLFVDSGTTICDNHFIERYIQHSDSQQIVQGGTQALAPNDGTTPLKYRYEHARERKSKQLRSANFLIPRSVMLQHPFCQAITTYGYEDVLLGEQLRQAGFSIVQIHNPICYTAYEDDATFIAKTEQALCNLAELQKPNTKLLRWAKHLPLPKGVLQKLKDALRQKLNQPQPSVSTFQCYKLVFLALELRNKNQKHSF